VRLLEAAGHQVTTPTQAGIAGLDDEIHFRFAAEHGYVLLTKNPDDFQELHAKDSQHAGVLLIYQDNNPDRDMSHADIVKAIANLEQAGPAVLRALAKSPEERWPDCKAFVQALDAKEGQRVEPSPAPKPKPHLETTLPEPPSPRPAPPAKKARRRLITSLIILTAVAPLLVIGFAIQRALAPVRYTATSRLAIEDVSAPPELQIAPLAEVQLSAGKSQQLAVQVKRIKCPGEVVLEVKDLPAGVSAELAKIADGAEEGEVKLIARADAKPATFKATLLASVGDVGKPQTFTTTVLSSEVAATIRNFVGMDLVLIVPGEFQMGSDKEEDADALPDELKHHPVRISRPFRLAAHKTTQEQFKQVLGRDPSWFSASGGGKDKVEGMDTDRFPVRSPVGMV
jgi:hypothetical protein